MKKEKFSKYGRVKLDKVDNFATWDDDVMVDGMVDRIREEETTI